jgi:hypothetical protein
MKQVSTSDQLLLLSYGELPSQDALKLQEQIICDDDLAYQWDTLCHTVSEMDRLLFSPSDTSVRIVQEHSYKTEHLQEI